MRHHATAQQPFDPAPSLQSLAKTKLVAATSIPSSATCVGIAVAADGDLPRDLGFDRAALRTAAFDGKVGQTLPVLRTKGPTLIAFGIGPRAELDIAKLRDAAAAFSRAAEMHEQLAIMLDDIAIHPKESAQAVGEGVLLARYRYLLKRTAPAPKPLRVLTLVSAKRDDVHKGLDRAGIMARAVELARDLAGAPGSLLTARRLAEIAQALGPECGLEVEVFDEKALLEMGCGGMLGVNAGSVEPPRMIKLTYKPQAQASGNVALVAKGIMFGDMSGAAAVLAAMSALKACGCTSAVTGYLMCTDNMPSATALELSDVITIRGGTTVEVINPDAEGRLVMADGLVLSTELQPRPDAIIDIATLTGACQRALGVMCAGVMGNDEQLVRQVKQAALRTDEAVWELPLVERYRQELESEIADLKNVGGENAGAITAGLFLEEFVGDIPWAHLDIAGTARTDSDQSWRPKGPTGYGTRLLIDVLTNFKPPGAQEPA